ncbi:hypothetical protein LY90DRAFT_518137 [Neocallimastix californiae]|uniref:Polysaccharide pyruvyl transferase domain-containing protein n=1 Tax=Neocallimastix californiae TaxID=1754190 RepID=A0A1Y1ZVH2_9FUNG|nr:hypothetical protein LY90DRAFT_518137 [Neocallimastix californiae]|eukprot:ORY13775.1 hypothetical protein LY90DRAFT_518137 [Neocallimastix californiae]
MFQLNFISFIILFINIINVYSNYNNKNVSKKNFRTAICAIAKMENDYINDWCRYHFNLGFDDIYIYDNNDENYEPVENRIDKDIISQVHIIKVPGKRKDFQRNSYNSFIKENYLKYDWCAFIDLDEFFVLKKWNNIKDFLLQEIFQNAEEIKFEWHLYGDNDEIKQDTTIPIYKRITKEVFPEYRGGHLSKPIIKGKKKFYFGSHHYARNIDKTYCTEVNIYGEYLNKTGRFVDKRYEDAYIAHYMTKTLDEFINQKFKRIEHNYDNPTNLMSQEDPFKRFQYFFNINQQTPEKLKYIKEKLNVDFIELEDGEYKMYEPGIKYWHGKPNAGDYFAIYLANKLKINERSSLAIMGNILSVNLIKDTKYFWGCSSTNGKDPLIKDVNRYYAVGGNKTLNILRKFGDISNIVICNPALLASFLYKPTVHKKYKICILSHWQDYELLKDYASNEINIIHMQTTDIELILDKINECQFSISTSLHGLVFSHSYGIKSIKLNLNDRKNKAAFKYEDYYSSINKKFKQINSEELNMIINSDEKLQQLKESISIPSSLEIVKKQLEYLGASPVQIIFSNMENIICTFIENNTIIEPEKIDEWITYHIKAGFSDIFIFNSNESLKNIERNFDEQIKDKVHLFNVITRRYIQNELVSYFYRYLNRYFESVTFVDINKYINFKYTLNY